jgi:uncharacterized phage protein gp47/JayE
MIATPTTQGVSDTIVSQVAASLEQTVPLLPKAFLTVLAKVLAGVFVILYKYEGFIFLQLFVAHASNEETVINGKTVRPLTEWGRLIGVGDALPATQAELVVTVTVTNQVGNLVGGAQLVRGDTNVIYTTVAARALNASTVTVSIKASSDPDGNSGAGTIGNLNVGDELEFASPLANVSRTVTVTSITVTGADAEPLETYRARIFRRFQRKPQGGAHADYEGWALGVVGVVNVYPYAGAPGEVDVYVECDASIDTDGIPPVPLRDAVFDAIEQDPSGLAAQRPVNAGVNVLPITRKAFDVFVFGLSVADETGTKDSIEEAVKEYLRSRAPFIVGLATPPRDDRVTVAALGGTIDTVVNAASGTVTSVKLQIDAIEETAYSLGKGEKAKLGHIFYG